MLMVACWYLEVLFIWRVTLSPLFGSIHDSPMMVKFALFAGATYVCYVLSDVVEFNPWVYKGCLEVFCFGPFFALGLLAPPKSWTTALTKPSIQVVGVLVLVLCCASLQIQMPFARSLSPSLVAHWLPREPVAAGRPERLLKHGLWFVYRATWSFGVLWSVAAFTSLWASLPQEPVA